MTKKRLLMLVLLVYGTMYPQSTDRDAALYNIGFGAVFSTVGAIINKEPDKPLGATITKALWQGAMGGYVTFESKRLLRSSTDNQWYQLWSAKVLNAAGTSIKENAAYNRDFWEQWHMNVGFNRIEIDVKDNFKIRYKVLPVALVYTTIAFSRTTFDIKKSSATGEFVFHSNDIRFADNRTIAVAYPGVIVYSNMYFNSELLTGQQKNETIRHEITHLYQSNDFSLFNTYTTLPLNNLIKKSETGNFIYKYVKPEFHYLLLRGAYEVSTNSASTYYGNFFENEARYFSGSLR